MNMAISKEDVKLLIVDICARLPYDVVLYHPAGNFDYNLHSLPFGVESIEQDITKFGSRPYLRPMSSMNEEEEIEYDATFATIEIDGHKDSTMTYKSFDFLNVHHFDYRGLIEKGLALEAPEGMYNLNK